MLIKTDERDVLYSPECFACLRPDIKYLFAVQGDIS